MSDNAEQNTEAENGHPRKAREETFRKTMRGRTPEGEFTTLIVTRQGLGQAGRTWLTFLGARKTTVVLTDQEAERLGGLLGDASSAREPQ